MDRMDNMCQKRNKEPIASMSQQICEQKNLLQKTPCVSFFSLFLVYFAY